MFEQHLPHMTVKTILDVGCGHGMMLERLSGHGNKVFGIDITPESLRYDKARGLMVAEADARNLPFLSNSFDLVYSLGVIEHFSGTEQALREQVRVCRPGGIIIVVVPNLLTPYYLPGILFEIIARRGHNLLVTYGKPYSNRQLSKMLERAGCDNVFVEPYYGSAFLYVFMKKLNHRLVDFFERSFLSKYCGLVLWGMGCKRGVT